MGCGSSIRKRALEKQQPALKEHVDSAQDVKPDHWKHIPWACAVPIPPCYRMREGWIQQTEHRAISRLHLDSFGSLVKQVVESFEITDAFNSTTVTWEDINLYTVCDHFVKPLTVNDSCSLVEMVTALPQMPNWYVSHWWGTPMKDTLSMLRFHAEARGLVQTAADQTLWVCTLANNQHCLEELNQSDLAQTPFVKALLCSTCVGTVMLMNENAEPFRRSWCTLENWFSTTVARRGKTWHFLDIAAMTVKRQTFYDPETSKAIKVGVSCVLLKDDGRGVLLDVCEQHGARFPASVAQEGVRACVAEANASRPEDKRNILRFIMGETNPNFPPPLQHKRYDEVNRSIHSIFAPRAFFQAAMDGNVEDVKGFIASGLIAGDILDWKNARGSTALIACAFKNHAELVELLLCSKAHPDAHDGNGQRPIHVAAQHNAVETIKLLLKYYTHVDVANYNGETPLMHAASWGQSEAMEVLLEARADLNAKCSVVGPHEGWAALHMAADAENLAEMRLLIEARADVGLLTADKYTASDLAAAKGSKSRHTVLSPSPSFLRVELEDIT